MKPLLIAAALGTCLFAVPAFADCAADYAKAQDAMKSMKMDDATTAMVKDQTAKITDAMTKKDEAACTVAVADLNTVITAKQ